MILCAYSKSLEKVNQAKFGDCGGDHSPAMGVTDERHGRTSRTNNTLSWAQNDFVSSIKEVFDLIYFST